MQLLVLLYGISALLALKQKVQLKALLQDKYFLGLIILWVYTLSVDIFIAIGRLSEKSMLYFSTSLAISFFIPMLYVLVKRVYDKLPNPPGALPHMAPFIIYLVSMLGFISLPKTDESFPLFQTIFNYWVIIMYFILLLRFTVIAGIASLILDKMRGVASKKIHKGGLSRKENIIVQLQEADMAITFTKEEIHEIKTSIAALMENNRPYLRQRFSLATMSKRTGIQEARLAAFLMQIYKMNCTEFVNMYRVEYCRKKLTEDKEWRKLSMDSIAEGSGFGNRVTFGKAFKKNTGMTPSEFLKQFRTVSSWIV